MGGRPLSLLAVGNPSFERPGPAADGGPGAKRGPSPSAEWRHLLADGRSPVPLPGTEKEVTEVARLYGGSALTGAAATEARVRQAVESADVVHLATHGYLHPTRAMSSGVLLAAPGGPAGDGTHDDGALQAWEIYSQLRLRAELVVLSGCETGRGQSVRGEGLIGLTRALQYAGARSVVASQWKVDDESTRALMTAMHRNLRRGLAKDEALRQAMVALRRDRRTAHPYDWAPFRLLGDPDNPSLGVPGGR